MIKNIYKFLKEPETSGRKIGIFRITCAIFGGLLTSYLGMTLLALLIPSKIGNTATLALMFNMLAWSIIAIWISLSSSKLIALLRFLIPTTIFTILIYILF